MIRDAPEQGWVRLAQVVQHGDETLSARLCGTLDAESLRVLAERIAQRVSELLRRSLGLPAVVLDE